MTPRGCKPTGAARFLKSWSWFQKGYRELAMGHGVKLPKGVEGRKIMVMISKGVGS
jgi:hypothetical protein